MNPQCDDWQRWVDDHGANMLLFARQWVPTHADAEDVVQEAFVQFWPKRAKVRDPLAYLYRCIRRRAAQRYRTNERRRRREAAVAVPPDQAMFAPPSQGAEQIELALASVPPEQRQVLVLKIWAQMTFPQIGQALGVSPNTAASRYRYGLQAMRRQLSEEPS